MALPSITTPEFSITLPSTGQQVRFRPFLVKEEKILLIAMESKDPVEISKAVRSIIQSCVTSDIDITTLATFDIEYLFLNLRGKSVSEVFELRMRHVDSECTGYQDITVNIEDIKVSEVNLDNKKIMLTDEIGVVVRYPTLEDVSLFDLANADDVMEMIAGCIEYAFDKENVYNDFTKQEILEWLDQFNSTQFTNLINFFNDIPKLEHTIEWTCPKCGESETVHLEGLTSFFT